MIRNQADLYVPQPEMSRIIARYDNWQTALAPRLILGLWHPLFLRSAYAHLPLLKRFHIGFSPSIVRKFFWDYCDGFSLCFPLLMGPEGQAFLRECREARKDICVWTVNNEDEMRVALSWGVKAVLTDKVGLLSAVKNEVSPFIVPLAPVVDLSFRQPRLIPQVVNDPTKMELTGVKAYWFPWSYWRYYSLAHVIIQLLVALFLRAYGPFSLPPLPHITTKRLTPIPIPTS